MTNQTYEYTDDSNVVELNQGLEKLFEFSQIEENESGEYWRLLYEIERHKKLMSDEFKLAFDSEVDKISTQLDTYEIVANEIRAENVYYKRKIHEKDKA